MDDMLRPGQVIDIGERLMEPLDTLRLALAAAKAARGSGATTRTAILVNCDLGVNRSPTLTLAFLVGVVGITLRDAYRLALHGRPGIDPLPNYRQGLRQYEMQVMGRGQSSVKEAELFALHISELLQVTMGVADDSDPERKVSTFSSDGSGINNEVDDEALAIDKAFALRSDAIDALLRESPVAKMPDPVSAGSSRSVIGCTGQ
jgi:hypothetical protein